MKKTVFTIVLAFLMMNVFADNSNKNMLFSDNTSEIFIAENAKDIEAKVYVFESGSQAIGYKYFIRAEIHNDYGVGVEANGDMCFKGSKKTIYEDHVILKIDDYAMPKVYWSVESSVLKIYFTK